MIVVGPETALQKALSMGARRGGPQDDLLSGVARGKHIVVSGIIPQDLVQKLRLASSKNTPDGLMVRNYVDLVDCTNVTLMAHVGTSLDIHLYFRFPTEGKAERGWWAAERTLTLARDGVRRLSGFARTKAEQTLLAVATSAVDKATAKQVGKV